MSEERDNSNESVEDEWMEDTLTGPYTWRAIGEAEGHVLAHVKRIDYMHALLLQKIAADQVKTFIKRGATLVVASTSILQSQLKDARGLIPGQALPSSAFEIQEHMQLEVLSTLLTGASVLPAYWALVSVLVSSRSCCSSVSAKRGR